MKLNILALAGTLLFAGGCAGPSAASKWETGKIEVEEMSVSENYSAAQPPAQTSAQTLVERTLQSFRASNMGFKQNKEFEQHPKRTYNDILQAAEHLGYKLFDLNEIGGEPPLVLIGWRHAPPGVSYITPGMKSGLQIILNTYEEGDILLPEGYASGETEVSNIYKPWEDMSLFFIENGSSLPETVIRKIGNYSVFFVGSDKPAISREVNKYKKMDELYGLWLEVMKKVSEGNKREGMPLLSAYLEKSAEYFPDLTEKERLYFGDVYDHSFKQMACQESDERELGYLLPTITGLNQIKKPHQLIYAAHGVGHLHRKKLLEGLRSRNIGFVALVEDNDESYLPGCD